MESERESLYRKLPQLGELLESAECRRLLKTYPRELVAEAARAVIAGLREEVKSGAATEDMLRQEIDCLWRSVESALADGLRPSLRPVINATGIVLQTNLGRAPLSEAAIARIGEVARGYCNLEMDLDTGKRSRRETHVEGLIQRVLARHDERCEIPQASLVVNNCAAATLLVLNSLADGGEVIVSRGELVEIGGGFRIPEILQKSGAILREVGTTNRTRIADYANAITPQTRLILRVHRSNFVIEGFTEQPTLEELIELGKQSAIPIFLDQGTGYASLHAVDGGRDGSSWVESVQSGAALVACSGDKLLGGPQCGILVGTRECIDAIRRNPLYRALRVDKLTYAALEATLLAYVLGEDETIPALAMLAMSPEAIEQRCGTWAQNLNSASLRAEVTATRSMIGGGTTPGASLPSFAVSLRHAVLSEAELAARLRRLEPPVVARISEGRVLLDLRTVPPESDGFLIRLLQENLQRGERLQENEPTGETIR